jgi:hypothetical protein
VNPQALDFHGFFFLVWPLTKDRCCTGPGLAFLRWRNELRMGALTTFFAVTRCGRAGATRFCELINRRWALKT